MITIGFILGFVGYLPLGNINLTVVQLSVSESRRKWQIFILFAALMEFIYCSACLYGMDQLSKQTQMTVVLNWSAVIIFLGLGIFSFLHHDKSHHLTASSSGLRRGVLIAIFNPLQIPFWLVWGVYVLQNGWVKSEIISIVIFSLLCSLGTVAVLWLYAVVGKKLVEELNINRNMLNRFIGSLLILLAIFQAFKLLHS